MVVHDLHQFLNSEFCLWHNAYMSIGNVTDKMSCHTYSVMYVSRCHTVAYIVCDRRIDLSSRGTDLFLSLRSVIFFGIQYDYVNLSPTQIMYQLSGSVSANQHNGGRYVSNYPFPQHPLSCHTVQFSLCHVLRSSDSTSPPTRVIALIFVSL